MNKHAMSIVVAYCLALAGCAAVREVTAPTLCSFSDADGRLYEAVDIEPLGRVGDGILEMRARRTRCDDVSRG